MRLFPKFEIRSIEKIRYFLNEQYVGRIASIDENGFPQVIPMNFVYVQSDNIKENNNFGAIYMHSHPRGEKIDNILRNHKVGFEVDLHVCFLPSYYFHPSDASQADTLYISVVIKGNAFCINNLDEKALALNCLMNKYQKEGKYEQLTDDMPSVREVTVIKIIPNGIKGKYKIGQHWSPEYRLKMAKNIVKREKNDAKTILERMGIDILPDGGLRIIKEPIL